MCVCVCVMYDVGDSNESRENIYFTFFDLLLIEIELVRDEIGMAY